MAIDEGDHAGGSEFSDAGPSDSTPGGDETSGPTSGADVRVGNYTWADFMAEYGYEDEIDALYPEDKEVSGQLGLDADGTAGTPTREEWNTVDFDPTAHLGFHPTELDEQITELYAPNAKFLWERFLEYVDPETTPVTKDVYTWEHYKWEYYYEDDGSRPRSGGEIDRFDGEQALGFDPDRIEEHVHAAGNAAMELDELVDERTVNVNEEVDEDEFFSTDNGNTTVANRYDLEKAVPFEKKTHFVETERYWVNKPYAFVVIFHSEKENETKYYAVEPYCNEIETELQEFLSGKLRTAIKYADDSVKTSTDEEGRRSVIERETRRLLKRYDLFEGTQNETTMGIVETVKQLFGDDEDDEDEAPQAPTQLEGMSVRPEPVILEEDPDTVSEYQVEKLLYLLKRDFIGYERIDPIKHDINVEDISCDGYNSPVFVYHSGYEQIISNIYHGEDDLDDFVVKLAQRSGKGISKRLPQVDATLPDGSRAQLTLGKEVSDHGTNYTIRQFKDVPFTPIDLINWNTFSLDEMAFLWLCIENHKSLIFAGGTASGKTTSLNAVSLFIPANTKIVSIEDTREVELPQRNWIASMTRPSFADDSTGDIDEFDLLEAALRQRPDYIVMGEIRGEEGRTLFQVMSTGHTTYTTFHADSVDEVLKRFTTDPINVSKTMFTALDLVSIQTQTRVQGRKVRRNKSLTEINHYEAENDEINVQDVYQWQAETDEYLKMGDSNTLDEIMFDRGWNHEKLQEELFKRKTILAYLIRNGLNTYAEVAATVQAFINDPETILTLIANGQLENSLDDLREMESVLIDVDPEKEELVPRPDASSETYNLSMDILERAEESLFDEYRGNVPSGLASAIGDVEEETADDETDALFEFDAAEAKDNQEDFWASDDGESVSFDESGGGGGSGATAAGGDTTVEAPAWLEGEQPTGTASADSAVGGQRGTDQLETTERPPLDGDVGTIDGSITQEESTGETTATPGQSAEDEGTLSLEEPTGDTDGPSEGSAGDEEESGGLDALFTDMDDTLAALESDEPVPAPEQGQDEDSKPDTSGFDEMFPSSDAESIFATGESTEDESEPDWGLGTRSESVRRDDTSPSAGESVNTAGPESTSADETSGQTDTDEETTWVESEPQPVDDESGRVDSQPGSPDDGDDSIFGTDDSSPFTDADPAKEADAGESVFDSGSDDEESIFAASDEPETTEEDERTKRDEEGTDTERDDGEADR
ncbi:type II secretion system protein E [Halovivax asiaticus JCM 14624]|uniref:Type II secretion system protein E n=1 Tax=Halovivax asiaticus JCM 14624 TaxID=1227490 RepID=M0BRP2_9EURY|nr:ATPase, T2SS/T4P/T4SS family [Halovivax asiaticus]ELZ13595.1 type II secretion system protein E [Halovivax asiaticus JCM 14624]